MFGVGKRDQRTSTPRVQPHDLQTPILPTPSYIGAATVGISIRSIERLVGVLAVGVREQRDMAGSPREARQCEDSCREGQHGSQPHAWSAQSCDPSAVGTVVPRCSRSERTLLSSLPQTNSNPVQTVRTRQSQRARAGQRAKQQRAQSKNPTLQNGYTREQSRTSERANERRTASPRGTRTLLHPSALHPLSFDHPIRASQSNRNPPSGPLS